MDMSTKTKHHSLQLCLAVILLTGLVWPVSSVKGKSPSLSVDGPTYTVREGFDFATRILDDPWDMSEYSDVSMGLDYAGVGNLVVNPRVESGVFKGTTPPGGYTDIYLLHPGYTPGVINGKTGSKFPISSSQFKCVSIAIQADVAPDKVFFHITWVGDRSLQPNGFADMLKHRSNGWNMYFVDLSVWGRITGSAWTSRPTWQGLRIEPAFQGNTNFAVDWVRLTDCKQVLVNLSGLGSGSYTLWVNTNGRDIQVSEPFSPTNGNYAWDVQGLPPGNYTYKVISTTGSAVQQGTLNVVAAPIIHFNRPSEFSGPDYASRVGQNDWNMSGFDDFTRITCASAAFNNGILSLDTLPPSQTPGCAGPGVGEADPMLYLNTPKGVDIRPYRYLSFRISQNGSYSMPAEGMIVRWIWSVSRPGDDCYYISKEIPLDVNWGTYTIDLANSWNGTPAESTPGDCGLVPWSSEARTAVLFRMDPNENITNWTFHQELDWIRLTQVDQVARGESFSVKIMLNKPVSELQSLSFYYTDNPANPEQHPAQSTTTMQAFLANGPIKIYLPFLRKPSLDPFLDQLPADATFNWNTSGVPAGQYYICAKANDGYNQSTYCSPAPVQVVSP